MDLSPFVNFFSEGTFVDVIFKFSTSLIALLFLLYSIVIAKQVKIMDKSLEAKFNQFIFFICSVQTTIALILLIFAIFL